MGIWWCYTQGSEASTYLCSNLASFLTSLLRRETCSLIYQDSKHLLEWVGEWDLLGGEVVILGQILFLSLSLYASSSVTLEGQERAAPWTKEQSTSERTKLPISFLWLPVIDKASRVGGLVLNLRRPGYGWSSRWRGKLTSCTSGSLGWTSFTTKAWRP